MKIAIRTLIASAALLVACTDQLDVQNPNQPAPAAIRTEPGIVFYGQGVYLTGFKDVKYYDGVPGYFWSGAIGNHELMGDVIGTDIANIFINQIGCPDQVTLDNNTVVNNPNSPNKQIDFIRITANVNSTGYQNSTYYEWAYMYNINNMGNTLLENVEQVTFAGDAETKKKVLQAWAYWWKGYAYSRIGSMYYAGLIVDTTNGEEINGTNNNFVTKEEILAEANSNLDKAYALLGTLTASADYKTIVEGLIPSFNRVGHGGTLTPVMWQHSINTFKARNILVNTRVSGMTTAQWNSILDLTANGVASTDFVFTGRTNASSDFLAPSTGTVSAKTTGTGGTYKISERLIQDFKAGDRRFTTNFRVRVKSDTDPTVTPYIGETSRGNAFFTRWELIDRGTLSDTISTVKFADQRAGGYELFLASSYEENALMRAEALIYTSHIDDGLALIDAVRKSQGAKLTAVAGTGLSLDDAKEELRKERRIGLLFRALSFYDARRWGVIDPVSAGGGRSNAVALSRTGAVNTHATINYNYLDYWDVPDNEIAYNPPAPGSAPTTNPRK